MAWGCACPPWGRQRRRGHLARSVACSSHPGLSRSERLWKKRWRSWPLPQIISTWAVKQMGERVWRRRHQAAPSAVTALSCSASHGEQPYGCRPYTIVDTAGFDRDVKKEREADIRKGKKDPQECLLSTHTQHRQTCPPRLPRPQPARSPCHLPGKEYQPSQCLAARHRAAYCYRRAGVRQLFQSRACRPAHQRHVPLLAPAHRARRL